MPRTWDLYRVQDLVRFDILTMPEAVTTLRNLGYCQDEINIGLVPVAPQPHCEPAWY